jgi:DNA topoisomerase I
VQDLPGQQLFQYLDENDTVQDIKSEDINDYIRRIAGDEFSAKDIRTWSGTVLAAAELSLCPKCASKAEAKRNITRAIEHAAKRLGNTPTICRKSYIHPVVLENYLSAALSASSSPQRASRSSQPTDPLRRAETAVLDLLREKQRVNPRKSLLKALRRSLKAPRRQPAGDSGGGARAVSK